MKQIYILKSGLLISAIILLSFFSQAKGRNKSDLSEIDKAKTDLENASGFIHQSIKAEDWISIKTSVGNGADAQVQGGSNGLLNVGFRNNSAIRNAGFNGGNYTTYLRFDLSTVSFPITNAKIKLTLATTASSANEFTVFALNDGYAGGADEGGDVELEENWPEGTQDWAAAAAGVINGDRAPAYNETSGTVNVALTTALGAMKLTDGLTAGTVIEFTSDKLVGLINSDANHSITLIFAGVSGNFGIKTKEAGVQFAPELLYMANSGDIIAPPKPENLSASNLVSSSVTLSWSASVDENSGTTGYYIYLNGTKYNSSLVKGTTVQLSDLKASTDYQVTVSAVDNSGNESLKSNPISFKTSDFTLKPAFVIDNDFAGPESAPKADELFTVNPQMLGSHPRILFSGIPVAELISRTQKAYYKKYWESIKTQALAAAQKLPPATINPANEDPWREYGRAFNWMAIAYKLDTDAARKTIYMNGIVSWINAFYGYERSTQDLVLSHLVIGVSCVYDWLYDDLPAETKAKARFLIIDNCRWLRSPTNEGATMWRDKQFATNHNWYNHAALAMGAVALYGEDATPLDPKEPAIWFAGSVRNFWEAQRRLTTDGVPVEGYNYTDYGLPPYIDMGVMVEQLTTPTAKLNLIDCPALKNQGSARLHLMLPKDYGFMAWSDSYWKHFNGSWIYRFLAHRFSDRESQYLADWLDTRGDADWRGLFWADDSVLPVAKENVSLIMDAKDFDVYTVRNSWSDNGDFFAYKCGTAGGKTSTLLDRKECTGHCHPDANNVEFWWKDNPILRAPGYAIVKATNYYHTTSFIANGISVEQKGAGQDWFRSTDYGLRQEDAFTIEAIHTEKYHTFLGESGGLYVINDQKCNYRRRVVYIPGGSVVIADRVSAPKAIDFEFRLLMSNDISLTNSGNTFSFTSGGTAGKITDYSPDVANRSITDLKLNIWDAGSQNRKVVGIKKANATSALFGVVINMGTNNAKITEINDNGIKVDINGEVVFFAWESADNVQPTAPSLVDIWQAYPKVLFVKWPAATDNIQVVGYKVYLDNVFFKDIKTTDITIPNLNYGTKYSIGVSSVDWEGNESAITYSSAYTLNKDGSPVSAVNIPEEAMIAVYPIPTSGLMHVSLGTMSDRDKTHVFSISDLTGKIVYTEKGNSPQSDIHISHLPGGIYLLRIQLGEKIFIKKIIKTVTN